MSYRVELFQKWAALDERKRALFGTKLVRMLNSFGNMDYIMSRNYDDLIFLFGEYEKKTEIWQSNCSKKQVSFFREFSRLLHNYLASTYTLIEQAKKLSETYEEVARIYEKKRLTLSSNDCYCFCRCLRHITQHLELLELLTHFSLKGNGTGKSVKLTMILNKDLLLESGEALRANEKEGFVRYICNHKEADLKKAIMEYQNLLVIFYREFDTAIKVQYANALQEFYSVVNEIQGIQLELKRLKKAIKKQKLERLE
jgi:hypothetical protein